MDTGSRRLPVAGWECQNKVASYRVFSSLLRCGEHLCVCMVWVCFWYRQGERESNIGKGLGQDSGGFLPGCLSGAVT